MSKVQSVFRYPTGSVLENGYLVQANYGLQLESGVIRIIPFTNLILTRINDNSVNAQMPEQAFDIYGLMEPANFSSEDREMNPNDRIGLARWAPWSLNQMSVIQTSNESRFLIANQRGVVSSSLDIHYSMQSMSEVVTDLDSLPGQIRYMLILLGVPVRDRNQIASKIVQPFSS